jgi:DNA-binding transcriptional MerR regulator
MLTLEEAAKTLGISRRQLRRRIEAARPVLAPYLRRGDKNRLMLDFGAIEILRQLQDAQARGRTIREALAEIQESLRGNHSGQPGPDGGQAPGQSAAASDAMAVLIEELRARIRYLEDENRWLRNMLENFQQSLPALSAPAPRKPWWRFWTK